MGVSSNYHGIAGDDDLGRLVDGACAGDEVAVERLIARFRSRVRDWAAHVTGDRDDAEDIAQNVLAELGAKVHSFDRRRRFTAWLFVITRRAALSAKRTESRRRDLLTAVATDTTPAGRDEPATDVTDETRALKSLVLTYFDTLPPKQRQVFELADLRGLSPTEIARQLSMPAATVRAHLFKARANIRRRMLANHEALVRDYRS